MNFETNRTFAEKLDREDPLASFREQFWIPKQPNGQDQIYFCGNSLGLQPKKVRAYVEEDLANWAERGVEGHFKGSHPFLPYHEFLTDSTARLVGAKPSEVVVMNTLTVNLHLMLVSFYRPTRERFKIMIERGAFPSDRYAAHSQIRFHGFDPAKALIELSPRAGEETLRAEDIIAAIEHDGSETALILLPGVQYYTGQVFDFAEITRAGHRKGCAVGLDHAHAAGNVPLKLHDWDVDFAVWCSYKYLNGGPGCLAGCFVHERHGRAFEIPRFAGWWGHNKTNRFEMGPKYEPIPGAEGWQLSNPPIFSASPLRASMEIFDEAGMERIRAKSERLTAYLEFLISQIPDEKFRLITPKNPKERGCQLSIQTKADGKTLLKKLTEAGVVCDWREPDVIRVAPTPLYNRFTEVHQFSEILSNVVRR